jgi:hypothetical protein
MRHSVRRGSRLGVKSISVDDSHLIVDVPSDYLCAGPPCDSSGLCAGPPCDSELRLPLWLPIVERELAIVLSCKTMASSPSTISRGWIRISQTGRGQRPSSTLKTTRNICAPSSHQLLRRRLVASKWSSFGYSSFTLIVRPRSMSSTSWAQRNPTSLTTTSSRGAPISSMPSRRV